jgi:hypothetical protein
MCVCVCMYVCTPESDHRHCGAGTARLRHVCVSLLVGTDTARLVVFLHHHFPLGDYQCSRTIAPSHLQHDAAPYEELLRDYCRLRPLVGAPWFNSLRA